MKKTSNIEVVEEIKYLGVIVLAKRNVFEGQKNEIMKKNQKIERDDKLCHRKKLPSSNDGENILERSGATKRAVRSRSNRHESRRNRQIEEKKTENTAMRRILKAPKWTAQAAIRGEIGISNMKARIARSRVLYLRRMETGNNEVLKIILEDSKKHEKSKCWETTRKYMKWAQIEEREIKERTAKEIRGKIAKIVEEEWREELLRDI